MTNKECIIAEIKRLLNEWRFLSSTEAKYRFEAYTELLEWIDSMPKEPVSKDLEEELDKYIKDYFTIDTEQLDRFGIDEKDYMYSMDKSDILALVEHFTKWQKEQIMKDAIDAELDDVCGFLTISIPYHNGIAGDKVKVIIIKSE